MTVHTLLFGTTLIHYSLEYSERKTLGITVTPAQQVLVKSPVNAKQPDIELKLRKRAPWVLKQMEFFKQFQPIQVPRQFRSGETHSYLGRNYQLKVRKGKLPGVHRKGREISLTFKSDDSPEMILNAWYRKQAKEKIALIALPILEHFEKRHKVQAKGIYIQNMKTRWGSCTPQGRILLNPELIKYPKPCIQYVIIHELCHLVHHSHSSKFFRLLSKEMPDWEKWKARLERG